MCTHMCTQGGAAGESVCRPSGDTDPEETNFQEREPRPFRHTIEKLDVVWPLFSTVLIR